MNQVEFEKIPQVEDKIEHSSAKGAAEALSQALTPMNHEDYKDFLTTLKSTNEKSPEHCFGNQLTLDFEHNIAHLSSNPALPIATSDKFAIVMPGEKLGDISKYEIENTYGKDAAWAKCPVEKEKAIEALAAEIARDNHIVHPSMYQPGELLRLPNHFGPGWGLAPESENKPHQAELTGAILGLNAGPVPPLVLRHRHS